LERLDRFMHHALPESIATAVCAVLDTRTSMLRISHAGHVPSVVVRARSATPLPISGDPLLGCSVVQRRAAVVELADGDACVLYSDGLIERRGVDFDTRLDRLCSEAAGVLEISVQDRAAELATRMVGDRQDDDVTVLLLRRRDPA
jgi:serine phosphatase RsbU (regulator of sigma subunit)